MEEDVSQEVTAPVEPPALPEPLPPPDRPTGLDLIKALALIWTALIFANIAVGILVVIGPMSRGEPVNLTEIDPRILLAGAALDWVVTLCVISYFAAWKYRRGFFDAFYLYRVRGKTFATAVLIAIGGSIAATAVMYFWGTGEAPMYDIAFNESEDGVRMSLLFAFFAVIVPPLEELYYRGFLFPVFSRIIGAKVAVVIVALWFVSIHAPQLRREWAALAVIACMSVIWTMMRYLTGSLVPSLVSHWVYNCCLIGLQFAAENFVEAS